MVHTWNATVSCPSWTIFTVQSIRGTPYVIDHLRHAQVSLIAHLLLLFLSWTLCRVLSVIHFLCWYFLWSETFWNVEINASLILVQLFYIVNSSSLSRFCEAWNLLLRLISNCLSLSVCGTKAVLNLCKTVVPVLHCSFSFIFILATNRL